MTRQLRISDPEIARQVSEADEIFIGKRLFVAVTVDDSDEEAALSPEEVEMVKEALADKRPALKGAAALDYLRKRGRELGLD